MKVLKRIAILGALSASLIVTGCNGFERTAFQTLSSSRDTIDAAQNDYEAPATPTQPKKIPHSKCAFTLINDAKAAQVAAVSAMVAYEEQKATSKDLTAQTAVAATSITGLASVVLKVKSLYSNPAAACGGAN